MSVAIALTLPDGIVPFADGRQTRLSSAADVIGDDIDKLIPLQERVFAVPFGITLVTDHVIDGLETAGESVGSPEDYRTLAEVLVGTAWAQFEANLPESLDPDDDRLKAGVLIGGMFGDRQFFVASMHGVGVSQDPLLEVGVQERITVVGDDDGGVQKNFERRYVTALAGTSWRGSVGPQNEVTRRIVKVGIATIRDLARTVPSVGGVIRYVLLRSGYPPLRGQDSG
jgi:hypothetical protein